CALTVIIQKTLILLYVSLCVAVGKMLMILFPEMMKRYILKQGQKGSIGTNPNFSYENWGPTFFSLKYLLFVLKVKWKRLEDEAFLGHNAPNTPVADFRDEMHHILDFMQGHEFNKLVEDFNSIADFLIIYIEEAHATDGWAFKNNIVINNHRNLQDRKKAAQFLLKENPLCPVVLDTMENLSSSKYAALPERLYLVQGGKVVYKGGVGPWNYNPEDIRAILEKLK
uniref:Iodothyronine deiodinase n=1 Tax=Chrysemys picta bellii TaxID=8478 RepID=A0A8C3F7M9_CHRPI